MKAIESLRRDSDIPPDSQACDEILRALCDLGLNLAFFAFKRPENSCFARTIDGRTVSHPLLIIYLKYDDDLRETSIGHRPGAWSEKGTLTSSVRQALNTVLGRHEDLSDCVFEQPYVSVYRREDQAIRQIGKQCKQAVCDLIRNEASGVEFGDIFWHVGRRYFVLMKNKADYKRVKRGVKEKVERALPALLVKEDVDGYCRDYHATIDFVGFGDSGGYDLIDGDIGRFTDYPLEPPEPE